MKSKNIKIKKKIKKSLNILSFIHINVLHYHRTKLQLQVVYQLKFALLQSPVCYKLPNFDLGIRFRKISKVIVQGCFIKMFIHKINRIVVECHLCGLLHGLVSRWKTFKQCDWTVEMLLGN